MEGKVHNKPDVLQRRHIVIELKCMLQTTQLDGALVEKLYRRPLDGALDTAIRNTTSYMLLLSITKLGSP